MHFLKRIPLSRIWNLKFFNVLNCNFLKIHSQTIHFLKFCLKSHFLYTKLQSQTVCKLNISKLISTSFHHNLQNLQSSSLNPLYQQQVSMNKIHWTDKHILCKTTINTIWKHLFFFFFLSNSIWKHQVWKYIVSSFINLYSLDWISFFFSNFPWCYLDVFMFLWLISVFTKHLSLLKVWRKINVNFQLQYDQETHDTVLTFSCSIRWIASVRNFWWSRASWTEVIFSTSGL